jgi:hypothetical protein
MKKEHEIGRYDGEKYDFLSIFNEEDERYEDH